MTMWGTQIAKLIFKKKNEIGGFTIPDVKKKENVVEE